MTNWSDIFLVDETFKAKFIHSLINIFVGYNLAFSCHSGIIQIPFFFSIYYSFYLMSCRLENLINKRFWPCWLFALSMLALFLMHYIYRFGKKKLCFFYQQIWRRTRFSVYRLLFQWIGFKYPVSCLSVYSTSKFMENL